MNILFRSSTLKNQEVKTNKCWLRRINKKELIPAKMITVYDGIDEKVIVNLKNLIHYKQPQIFNNDEKLFENPSKPPSWETISHYQLTSIEINQSLPSVENTSDIFPTLPDEYQHPNFTDIMPHSSTLEQLTKTNIANYSNSSASSAISVTSNISIVPPFS